MNAVAWEILIILLLVIINGVFAMAEIAVVSARRVRLKKLAADGDSRARTALALAESPNRFLSTVQVGITLVGILAGAFGGLTLAAQIGGRLAKVGPLAPYAQAIGVAVVVVAVTYLSLVLGELVPKRLALSAPEQIARLVAGPMNRLTSWGRPIVWLLDRSSGWLLRLLGIQENIGRGVSEDEIKILLREGIEQGVFQEEETEMIESVLALDRLPVREIMTPQPKIIWLNQDDPHAVLWHKVVVSRHSCFPVYRGNRDHLVGIVSVKSLYANLAAGIPIRLADLVTAALVVPETQRVGHLLETMRESGEHLALAADEFGGIVGLVTMNDVLGAIVGDFLSFEERLKPVARQREDGSWLVDAMIDVLELERVFPEMCMEPPAERDYHTLAGFVFSQLGHLPHEGEIFEAQGYRFEILDMGRHRVDKVLVTRLPSPSDASGQVPPAGQTSP